MRSRMSLPSFNPKLIHNTPRQAGVTCFELGSPEALAGKVGQRNPQVRRGLVQGDRDARLLSEVCFDGSWACGLLLVLAKVTGVSEVLGPPRTSRTMALHQQMWL